MPIPLLPVADPDDALLQQIVAGEAEAFVVLFRRYRHEVHRFATHMIGSPTAAEDVTQEVFMTVMREALHFDPQRGTVIAWLLGIARNQARRRLARERWWRPLGQEAVDGNGTWAITPDPLGDLDRAERIEALRRAVMTLPVRYREVILLCDLEELSYADAAAALNCAVGTVRSRLHRARALLAAKLKRAPHGSRPAIALA